MPLPIFSQPYPCSPISSLLALLLQALLLRPILEALLDLLALVAQLKWQHVPSVLFVAMTTAVLPGDARLAPVLGLGVVLAHAVMALS